MENNRNLENIRSVYKRTGFLLDILGVFVNFTLIAFFAVTYCSAKYITIISYLFSKIRQE